jgi:hypothetical protein
VGDIGHILTFGQYAAYFVRTYGWYENNEAVFITMEYFPLGDLEKFMRDSPPFSEEASMQIVQQLLEGVECMHENGFAHRDIKPGVSDFSFIHIAVHSERELEHIGASQLPRMDCQDRRLRH